MNVLINAPSVLVNVVCWLDKEANGLMNSSLNSFMIMLNRRTSFKQYLYVKYLKSIYVYTTVGPGHFTN